MLKIGLIGYGYWGINLLRNFMNTPQCTVKTVCDARPERLQAAQRAFPSVGVTTSVNDLLQDTQIDAVVVVTPVFLHYELTKKALENGKHVLVEKPFTASTVEAIELINLAQQKNLKIMVDHTFLFTGSVQKLKALTVSGELGEIQYFDSVRINLGLFQPDVNVIWDLAPHDISILNHLVKEKPISVNATGVSHTANGLENIAYLTVNYQSNFMAHFACSWVSPLKVRRILLGGNHKMVLYDDVEPTEKLKVYDTGFSVNTEQEKHKMLIDYRAGDIFIPKIVQKEALSELASNFVQSILEDRDPFITAMDGYDVVKILEAAQNSIKQQGKEVKI
jgi:predicted dehydrogenase